MVQPLLFDTAPRVQTVREINAYLRQKFEADINLQDVWLQGEVSNWKQAASGHIYFTLKDNTASIRSVIWRSKAERLRYLPRQDGEAVLAHGYISVYEAGGNYQFYVDDLEPVGQGALYAKFERIKAHLAAEGLFEPMLKQPLPALPLIIGVVTSPDAAAWRDILNVLRRRYPLAQVILSPTAVQGNNAPRQLVQALERLAQQPVEVIIISRGGGSIEDLWAFNDEQLARTIAACPIPVVSGVGHETDFTIADFVADVRAPTPSAAAELVSPDEQTLRQQLGQLQAALAGAVGQKIEAGRSRLTRQQWALSRLSPLTQINARRQQIDALASRAERSAQHRLSIQRERLQTLSARLETLNPLATLARGYAVVQKADQVITAADQISSGDRLTIKLSQGEIDATAE